MGGLRKIDKSGLTILLLLVACALLAATQPEKRVESESPRITLDGVALGMSLDEVLAVWSDCEVTGNEEQSFVVKVPGMAGGVHAFVDHDKGVTFVMGRRARSGERLLAAVGEVDTMVRERLGPSDPSLARPSLCGYSGPFVIGYFRRGDAVVEVLNLSRCEVKAQVLRQLPEALTGEALESLLDKHCTVVQVSMRRYEPAELAENEAAPILGLTGDTK